LDLDQKTTVMCLLNGVPVETVQAEAFNLPELREELGIPEGHLIVGTVAVFSRQKRLHDWLETARRVAGQRRDVTFVLAGYGPEEQALKDTVHALELDDRVRMPGFRPDGRRLLALLDIYLMTSEYEGLPMALLEAMALSKPVVATAVGGIPEVVQHGREGFLTAVAAVDELAQHTVRLLDSPELRSEMGERGARQVETGFHIKSRIKAVENIYLKTLGCSGKSAR
jgi:glycosyltransferase involved in cell wall biosynthesis